MVKGNIEYGSKGSVDAELFHLYGEDAPVWYRNILIDRLRRNRTIFPRECLELGCRKDCLHCSFDTPLQESVPIR